MHCEWSIIALDGGEPSGLWSISGSSGGSGDSGCVGVMMGHGELVSLGKLSHLFVLFVRGAVDASGRFLVFLRILEISVGDPRAPEGDRVIKLDYGKWN